MNIKSLLVIAATTVGLAGYGSAAFADAAAGKKIFDDICAECHEVMDFQGEDLAEQTATIKKIVAKQAKHKKALTLTDQQVADVAAFMVGGVK